MKYTLGDRQVKTAGDDYWIAPGAHVMGDVRLGAGANIWFGTVVRGDNDPITIGAGCNVQDGCILHADPGFPLTLGDNVSIGHMVMLHGCEIGAGSLIGIGTVILNGARIGRDCLIGAGALITEGKQIPDGSVVFGAPGKVVRQVTDADRAMLQRIPPHYVTRSRDYAHNLKRDD